MVELGPSTSGGSSPGGNLESVEVGRYTQPAVVGEPARINFTAEIGEPAPDKDLDVDFVLYVFTAQDPITIDDDNKIQQNPSGALSQQDLDQNTVINGTVSVTYDEPTDSIDFWLLAGFDYHGASGYREDRNFPDYRAWSNSKTTSVEEPEEEPEVVQLTDEDLSVGPSATGSTSPAQQLYPQADFKFFDIQLEDDGRADVFGEPTGQLDGENLYRIDFEYAGNPNIAIDTGGRFVKHEIIGGPVVRQKVGEEPDQYSIDGVCYQDTAKQIDALKDARFGKIASERIPGRRGQPVQFASASTEPIAEGGGADIPARSFDEGTQEPAQFLYTFSVNAIEIHRNIQETDSTTELPDEIAGGL